MAAATDTICALATPAGKGGVGIIRVSGPASLALCQQLTKIVPKPRHAQFASFTDAHGQLLDQGLILYFQTPRSFTGEDVIELHIHGSPVVADLILAQLIAWGARAARPGEFSERAFLNDKLDLAQAEAIADLIDSASATAARYALRSLRGDFSNAVNALVAELTNLRVYVEAAIDFPDEDVDFLAEDSVKNRLNALEKNLDTLLKQAKQGVSLHEGLHLVLAGAPNVGKSSLLNALAGFERAIVTDIPGTTRDLLDSQLTLRGLPIHITDTAGLHDSNDPVEKEGIRRARQALTQADGILLVMDASVSPSPEHHPLWQELLADPALANKTLLVLNKIDLRNLSAGRSIINGRPCVQLSALTKQGLDLLTDALCDLAGFAPQEEGGFMARRRHLSALLAASAALARARLQLDTFRAGELMAEDLRTAQDALGEITGKLTSDDLLGEIFGSFCIGK
ncbi:MAG: tRNA uridine-5-carboxymethylaminomethyl(34) synthesis GTPase MnmE [Pseudomonadales bacterium]|jgi:tRNA modification GTPase|nr:tRNA uridine-5-carboxymethylaminomethyl(34) synthesis GTPase MnmE [Pseudomonadales bacterium]